VLLFQWLPATGLTRHGKLPRRHGDMAAKLGELKVDMMVVETSACSVQQRCYAIIARLLLLCMLRVLRESSF
jgi:hypothetical protein